MASGVHLVGSVGLETVDDVFALVGRYLGPHLKRTTDGETGARRDWFLWQYPLLHANPALEKRGPVNPINRMPLLDLRPDAKAEDVRVGELSYGREARASYQDFAAAQDKGILPAGIRFQVSLPTPFAVVRAFIGPDSRAAMGPVYQRAMIREIQTMCDRIPHEHLCIQFDVCLEMFMWDGGVAAMPPFAGMEEAFAAQFEALGSAVPADVQLGFHICYGDYDGRPETAPKDASKIVSMIDLIASNLKRPITYFHAPIPVHCTDDTFFAPLRDLRLAAATELYLGLVHAADGTDGAQRRVTAARKFVNDFGIAAPCGLGRSKVPIPELLKLHADVAKACA